MQEVRIKSEELRVACIKKALGSPKAFYYIKLPEAKGQKPEANS